MKQSLLRILLPKTCPPLYAGQFKEMVAKAADGDAGISPAVWHYTAEGNPIPDAEPDIRFVGGKGWVGILSVSGQTDAIYRLMPHALSVAGKHAGEPVPMELEYPDFGVEMTDYPIRYFVRDAVAKHSRNRDKPPHELLTRMICRRLATARNTYNLDLPQASPREDGRVYWEDDHSELAERLGIFVAETKRIGMRLETANGQTNQFVGLLNGSFVMNAKLQGIWQIGNLPSRGYGRLVMDFGGAA